MQSHADVESVAEQLNTIRALDTQNSALSTEIQNCVYKTSPALDKYAGNYSEARNAKESMATHPMSNLEILKLGRTVNNCN